MKVNRKAEQMRQRRYIRLKKRIREICSDKGYKLSYRDQHCIAELYAHYPAQVGDATLWAACKAHNV